MVDWSRNLGRSRPRRAGSTLLIGILIAAAIAVSGAATSLPPTAREEAARSSQAEHPRPPEHYPALNAWVRGEILSVHESGGVVLLGSSDPLGGSSGSLLRNGGGGTAIELRYAKGWVYFDDPDGGPQERVNLREARARLRPGQLFEVGHSTVFSGGYDRGATSITAPGGTVRVEQVRFRGIILIRVNPYRSDPDWRSGGRLEGHASEKRRPVGSRE